MPFECIDGIVYINLDYRTDRKAAFLKEMERLNVPKKNVYRISAEHFPMNGTKGCYLSHLKALDFIQKKGWDKGLILEDDCVFLEDLEKLKRSILDFFAYAQSNWDVFFLGGNFLKTQETPWKNFVQVQNSRRSHAYFVRKEYISTLADCYQKAYEKIKHILLFQDCFYQALDRCWDQLQIKHRWFGPSKPLAFQSDSYSDIECLHRSMR